MSIPRPEGLPPVSSGMNWTPRVRLYLFEPCDGCEERDLRPDARVQAPAEPATFDPPLDGLPKPERPA
jgi:hypothetical protein